MKPSKWTLGLSVIELLILLAILGVVFSIAIFNGRQALTQREEIAALNTIRQSIWQGATAASSRGSAVVLNLVDRSLELRMGSEVIRRDQLPEGLSTNFPQGQLLEFSPPGKVVESSLTTLMDRVPRVTAGGRTYELEVSIIGEVRATEVR